MKQQGIGQKDQASRNMTEGMKHQGIGKEE
jgi:hypothetical protein